MKPTDSLSYYWLENYLFECVRPRFHQQTWIGAFDFFSIVIWKSNRSKSRIANRLRQIGGSKDLEDICKKLSGAIYAEPESNRLRFLLHNWGFRLPIASAILSVLWPDTYTVYDVRVRKLLEIENPDLAALSDIDEIVKGYNEFKRRLKTDFSAYANLRDMDRAAWGLSTIRQLEDDIERGFPRPIKA